MLLAHLAKPRKAMVKERSTSACCGGHHRKPWRFAILLGPLLSLGLLGGAQGAQPPRQGPDGLPGHDSKPSWVSGEGQPAAAPTSGVPLDEILTLQGKAIFGMGYALREFGRESQVEAFLDEALDIVFPPGCQSDALQFNMNDTVVVTAWDWTDGPMVNFVAYATGMHGSVMRFRFPGKGRWLLVNRNDGDFAVHFVNDLPPSGPTAKPTPGLCPGVSEADVVVRPWSGNTCEVRHTLNEGRAWTRAYIRIRPDRAAPYLDLEGAACYWLSHSLFFGFVGVGELPADKIVSPLEGGRVWFTSPVLNSAHRIWTAGNLRRGMSRAQVRSIVLPQMIEGWTELHPETTGR